VVANWLKNDWFFLAAIAATIALAFLFPALKDWVGKWTITLMLKAAWKDVKEGFADILDFIHIIELETINTILQILWPDYREAMGELSLVVGALSAELGEGTGYIHAYFSVIHGLAIVEGAFMGTDPKLAEMSAFEDTSEGIARVSEKFREYAYDPGLIVSDIINDFYLSRAENIRIAQQGVIGSVRDSRDKIVTINLALHDFKDRLTHFIEMSPEELKEVIDERLQPIADALADGLFIVDTEIMPKVDGIIEAAALREELQQTINDNVLARISDPYQLLLQAEFMSPEDLADLEDYIAELEGRAAQRDDIEPLIAFLPVVEEANQALAVVPVEVPAIPSLSYEAPGFPVMAETPSQRTRDWFVGEW